MEIKSDSALSPFSFLILSMNQGLRPTFVRFILGERNFNQRGTSQAKALQECWNRSDFLDTLLKPTSGAGRPFSGVAADTSGSITSFEAFTWGEKEDRAGPHYLEAGL